MANIVKWKVGEAPTGRYRSFTHRSWPTASYAGDKIAAQIYCTDSYTPSRARDAVHAPLTLHIADYSTVSAQSPAWTWRRVKGEFNTLAEAKAAFDALITKFPDFKPR